MRPIEDWFRPLQPPSEDAPKPAKAMTPASPVDVDADGIRDEADWRSGLLPQCPLTFEEVVIPTLEEYLQEPTLLRRSWEFTAPNLRRQRNEDDDEDDYGYHRMGYTTILKLLTHYRRKLVEHRKDKKLWTGRAEEYRTEERRLVAKVRKYKERSEQPYYAKKIRRAKNRARRKTHPRLRTIPTVTIVGENTGEPVPPELVRFCLSEGLERNLRVNPYLAHLPWMLTRIRKKRFKTKLHLAYWHRKPIAWVEEALAEAVKMKMITEEELKACFRGPGRPKKGVPRGPYRKRGTKRKQDISPNLLPDMGK